MRVIDKNRLSEVFDRLSRDAALFVPLQRHEQSGYYDWKDFNEEADQLQLEALNTYLSPKEVIFPQTERMYSFHNQGSEVEVLASFEDAQPRIIFGLRACDLAAITCLDSVFLTLGYEDSFYRARRDNVTLVARACYQPGPYCFCSSMGVDPVAAPGADVLIHDCGEVYAWESQTSQGEALTNQIADLLEEKEVTLPALQPFTRIAPYSGVAAKLKNMFDHPLWEELSPTCQNCGICTYLCPSCYCFDIQVKNFGEEGYRFRCYDSCMYGEYSLMAGGHNPRPTGRERFRNRFLHKLEFFSERYGKPLCTGCGRCIVACPAGIDITEIISKIQEVDDYAG